MTRISASNLAWRPKRLPGDEGYSSVADVAPHLERMRTPVKGGPHSSVPSTHYPFSRGFTLLEIMLVLGILGMAALLLVPGLATLDSPGFNAQARELSGLFNYARRSAVVQGHPMRVEVWGSEPHANTEQQPTTLAGRWGSDTIIVEYADATQRWQPVHEQQAIMFYPEGGSTGGDLRLQQGGRMIILSIDPFSGRLTRREPD